MTTTHQQLTNLCAELDAGYITRRQFEVFAARIRKAGKAAKAKADHERRVSL